ncbi:MAG: FecR domain-containing protein [Gammaproteobacteria bacterium]|nr:FecR domain-containing protein [Gammaproteobacteria bacterium]
MGRTIKPILSGIVIFILGFSSAYAEEFRGRIVKIQGEVYVINQNGEQRNPEKNKFLLNSQDTVVTRKNARAVVQLGDGALSVLNEKSSLRVEESGWISQLGGKVYYIFRKVFGNQPSRQVKTNFATIGVRGTTFIVYENEDGKGVALEDGKLNIESPGEDYAIYKKQQADDFESFKQQMQDKSDALNQEFKDYQQNLQKEFVEYKKQFDLEANQVVSFDGNRVDQAELSGQLKADFSDFAAFAGEHVDAYHELEEATGETENGDDSSF